MTEKIAHNITYHCSSIMCSNRLRGLPRSPAVSWGRLLLIGEAISGTAGSSTSWTTTVPCLGLLDGAHLLASVDLPLQFTPHGEVQSTEVWTYRWPGLRLHEGRANLPQKRFDNEWPDFMYFAEIYVRNNSTMWMNSLVSEPLTCMRNDQSRKRHISLNIRKPFHWSWWHNFFFYKCVT